MASGQEQSVGLGHALLTLSPFLFLSIIALQRRYASPISDIPGPFLASMTILWQVWHIIKGRMEEDTLKLHQKYGYFVRLSHKEVSVSHPEAIRAILLAPLRKSDWYKIMALPNHHHQTPMSEVDPKRRVERYKNVAAAYSLSNIIKSESHIDKVVELLETRLNRLAEQAAPVEFDKWFNYMAFDVIGEVAFSSAFGFTESGSDIGGSIANTRFLTVYITVMGYFQWLHRLTLGNPLIEKYNLTPSQHIFDTCKRAVTRRKNNPNVRFDMMEQWLTSLKQNPDRMTEDELYGVANATIGAGADTISASLQAFWYYLLKHPQYLEKLRAEVDEAAASGKLSRVVRFTEAQHLPYLQACIKETFRWHPAVPFGLPRVVSKGGLTIGTRHFTGGTHISINPFVIHRSPEFFGPTAGEYNPERWLAQDGQARDSHLVQFGAGYNSCPGQHLARMEISKVAATLARDYDIRLQDPKKEWKFEAHFTAVPYAWPCLITRRSESD